MLKQLTKVKRFKAGSCRGVKLSYTGVGGPAEVFLCEDCKHVTVTGNLPALVPVKGGRWKTVQPFILKEAK